MKRFKKDQRDDHGHYFTREKGIWTCSCGAMRNKHGKPFKVRGLRAI